MLDREVEDYLRQFEPLRHVSVQYKSPEAAQIAPFLMTLSGYVSVYGEVLYYEADLDLRDFHSGDDLKRLAVSLIMRLEAAEDPNRRLH